MNTQEAIGLLNYMLRDIENDAPNGKNCIEAQALTHAIEHMKQTVGYDLLPIIPTPEMMQAGSQIKPNPEKDGSWGYVNRVYHAMIGAAPTVKQYLTVEPPQENRGAPEGWQLVPKKPTVEMKIVGRTTHWKAVEIYKEMLSAAPEPPQERKD